MAYAPTWMAVELPMKVADILRPLGGMSQTAVLMLLGILDILYVRKTPDKIHRE